MMSATRRFRYYLRKSDGTTAPDVNRLVGKACQGDDGSWWFCASAEYCIEPFPDASGFTLKRIEVRFAVAQRIDTFDLAEVLRDTEAIEEPMVTTIGWP